MTEPTPHPNRRTILKTGLAAAALAPRPMLAESITAADHPDAAPPRAANAATMRGVRFDRRDTAVSSTAAVNRRARRSPHGRRLAARFGPYDQVPGGLAPPDHRPCWAHIIAAAGLPHAVRRALVVRGVVIDGVMRLSQPRIDDVVPTGNDVDSPVSVDLLNATGRVLLTRNAVVGRTGDSEAGLSFVLHVALNATLERSVRRIRARAGGAVAEVEFSAP